MRPSRKVDDVALVRGTASAHKGLVDILAFGLVLFGIFAIIGAIINLSRFGEVAVPRPVVRCVNYQSGDELARVAGQAGCMHWIADFHPPSR